MEQVTNLKGETTHLVNPGTIGGVGKAPATFLMADLEQMQFERVEISKQIEREAGY